MNAGGRLLSGAAFSYHTAAKPQPYAPPFALCRIVPTFASVFFIGDNRYISQTYRDVLRPFLIRRGRPPLCLHNDEKAPFKPQHEKHDDERTANKPGKAVFLLSAAFFRRSLATYRNATRNNDTADI